DPETAWRRLHRHHIRVAATPSKKSRVIVVQDAFTTFYEPAVLEACCLLLRALGFEPLVLPWFENGKARHVKGFLRDFTRVAEAAATRLREAATYGLPLVGIEPAVTLTWRDEYPHVLQRDLGFRVHLFQEWLSEQKLERRLSHEGFRLFSHCTEQALVTTAPRQWARLFEMLGVPLQTVKAGCCGMCGVFGLEASHREESLGIFDLSWKDKIDRERDLVTGFSCRHQVQRSLGFAPLHPAQALLALIG
ncbi:MAG: (Fe-S)-binding protein, partial [Candidatus Xenobia bacterium]